MRANGVLRRKLLLALGAGSHTLEHLSSQPIPNSRLAVLLVVKPVSWSSWCTGADCLVEASIAANNSSSVSSGNLHRPRIGDICPPGRRASCEPSARGHWGRLRGSTSTRSRGTPGRCPCMPPASFDERRSVAIRTRHPNPHNTGPHRRSSRLPPRLNTLTSAQRARRKRSTRSPLFRYSLIPVECLRDKRGQFCSSNQRPGKPPRETRRRATSSANR